MTIRNMKKCTVTAAILFSAVTVFVHGGCTMEQSEPEAALPLQDSGSPAIPAEFTDTDITLTFRTGWGTNESAVITGKNGSTFTAPSFTRGGYTFTGWQPAVPDSIPSAGTVYTAQWQAVPVLSVTDLTVNYDGISRKFFLTWRLPEESITDIEIAWKKNDGDIQKMSAGINSSFTLENIAPDNSRYSLSVSAVNSWEVHSAALTADICAQSYYPGQTVYKDGNGRYTTIPGCMPAGVIFSVYDNGNKFKMTALNDAKNNTVKWCQDRTYYGRFDEEEDNGKKILDSIKEFCTRKKLEYTAETYPALYYCEHYDDSTGGYNPETSSGWLLPVKNELSAMYMNISAINASIQAAGGTTLKKENYWTASQSLLETFTCCCWIVSLADGTAYEGSRSDTRSARLYNIRAVICSDSLTQ